jgi:hypothetical protein
MIRNGFRPSPADYSWPLMAELRTIGMSVGQFRVVRRRE